MTTRVLPQTPSLPNIYLKWIVTNALAELIGLGTVALLVVLLMPRLEAGITFGLASLLFAAVLFEGLCVGVAQWWVLRERLELKAASWIGMTVLGGAVAWLIGMVAGSTLTFESNTTVVSEPSLVFTLLLAGLMGLGLGGLLGTAQWVVLRRYVERGVWWIAANGLAWAVGMTIIFATTDVLAFIPLRVLAILSAIVALLLTGGLVGAVHGSVLVWLLSAQEVSSRLIETQFEKGSSGHR
jgi:hypothetical protein